MMNSKPKYDKDFYAWALYSAKLLRQGKFEEIDVEHVAEEVESMGKRDKRALINRLAVLLAHLLKGQFQQERRGNSWKITIKEQRIKVFDLLTESPSLNHELMSNFKTAYVLATLRAARETGFAENVFPKKCPYSLEQCLDNKFLPE